MSADLQSPASDFARRTVPPSDRPTVYGPPSDRPPSVALAKDGPTVSPPALSLSKGPTVPPSTGTARRRTAAFRCFPGSSRSRIQGLLGLYYPSLWQEIESRWLPSARPIDPGHLQANGDYSRATLADVLIGLGEGAREWDGFEVCDTLKHFYGWQADFHLAALIHAWSTGLTDRMRDRK